MDSVDVGETMRKGKRLGEGCEGPCVVFTSSPNYETERATEVLVAERVFSIVARPDTGLELFEIIKAHVQSLHEQGLSRVVGYDVMSNGRVFLLKVRGPEMDVLPSDETLEQVLDDAFVARLEALAEELVDGFYVPSFAHCVSESARGAAESAP